MRVKPAPSWRQAGGLNPGRPSLPHPYLSASIVFALLVISAVVRWQLWTFGTDTGLFAQAILNAGAGFTDGPEAGSHFCFHWSPILIVFTPLMVIFRQALLLQFGQSALLLATAFPLYALARRYTPESTARLFATVPLLYTPLLGVAFQEFHELAFFPVLIIAAIEALDRRAWILAAAYGLAALFVREDALLVTATLGLVLLAIGRGLLRPRLGAQLIGQRSTIIAGGALIAASCLTLAFYYLVVIPHYGPWQPSQFYSYPFAQGPVAVVLALLHDPRRIGALLNFGRTGYVLEALVPLVFLPLFSGWSLAALPGFAVVLLSSASHVWRMGEHYAALWLPFLLLGALDGYLKFALRKPDLGAGVASAVAAPEANESIEAAAASIRDDPSGNTKLAQVRTALCAVMALNLIVDNHFHFGYYFRSFVPHRVEVQQALNAVPHDARLLVNDQWFPHIAMAYPQALTGPTVDYDWAIIDHADRTNVFLAPLFRQEARAGRIRVVKNFASITVYQRSNAQTKPHVALE